MNPCACGYFGDSQKPCTCAPAVVTKYQKRIYGPTLDRVWRGIAAVEDVHLAPIKLNTVVVRGLNSNELPALARLTLESYWHIRFIEVMPIGNAQDWGEGFPAPSERYVSVQEMKAKLVTYNLQPETTPVGNGPARTYRIPGALGTIGFISPLGEHFSELQSLTIDLGWEVALMSCNSR